MSFKKVIKMLIVLLVIILAFNICIHLLRGFFPAKYVDEIKKYSEEYSVDPYLVMAVIKAESNYQKEAISNKDAGGLMQITPSTAKWIAEKIKISDFKDEDVYKPEINIKLGCYYLSYLYDMYADTKCMLAAYNAGHGTVDKWLCDTNYSTDGKTLEKIPYKETEQYINKVNSYTKIYRILYKVRTGSMV
ncbi:MAG: lytic transglycosylase domain-containing protein [Clostridia bacterium]|nr:lytic transglycosylase domain-containing protein [Clostridia bacterium]